VKKATTACTYCAIIQKRSWVPPKSWLEQVKRIRSEMQSIAHKMLPVQVEMAQHKSEIYFHFPADNSKASPLQWAPAIHMFRERLKVCPMVLSGGLIHETNPAKSYLGAASFGALDACLLTVEVHVAAMQETLIEIRDNQKKQLELLSSIANAQGNCSVVHISSTGLALPSSANYICLKKPW
jgi:hypothetical protein